MKTLLVIMLTVMVFLVIVAPASAGGATQISGIGEFASGGCTDGQGAGSDYALTLEGDLDGCVYVFIATAVCSPSGTYVETGTETYVVESAEGHVGTFETNYRFTGKFEDCPNAVGEIFGRCQHPIAAGSGTGDFEGVTGRLDFKDDVAVGNFPYRGHLRW